jgi:hypothetical protein
MEFKNPIHEVIFLQIIETRAVGIPSVLRRRLELEILSTANWYYSSPLRRTIEVLSADEFLCLECDIFVGVKFDRFSPKVRKCGIRVCSGFSGHENLVPYGRTSGIHTVKRVPSRPDFTEIDPWCSSTILFDSVRPTPVP